MQRVVERARELLKTGAVARVLGWEKGEFDNSSAPAFITDPDKIFYDESCMPNLAKYMLRAGNLEGKTLVILKPCDSRGMNLLINEHRVDRDKLYLLGAPCRGDGSERCLACSDKSHAIFDEEIESDWTEEAPSADRYARVLEIENMSSEDKYAFWRSELSRCIRCNACRNACPACSCRTCVFDNAKSGVASKANSNDFEEKLFHVIRAYHVAGRCVDCGECSRVCPQKIPLHLLNRKFILDADRLYGNQSDSLTNYDKGDPEPNGGVK